MRLLLLLVTLVSLFLSIDAVRLRSLPSSSHSRHAIPTKKHAVPRSNHPVSMINPQNHLVNDATKPQQIVTGLTNKTGELMISWLTFAPSNKPIIRYQSPHQGTQITVAAHSDFFLDPQSGQILRFIHTAKLTGLTPSTNYSYIVGDSQNNTWSDPLYFITIPSGNEIVRLGIYGDLGLVNSQSLRYLNEEVIVNRTIDAMLQIGDFAYDLHTDNGTLGDAWMNMMQNMTSLVPFMGCPGNHESRYNFTHFVKRFAIWDEAGKQTKSGFNWWYSWDYRSGGATVHMVSINTEVYYNNHGELPTERAAQFAWLDADLSAARSRGVDWLIVYGHRPMYCSNVDDLPDCSIDAQALRDGWLNPVTGDREYGMEALFGKHKVDIYFTAHEHSYERTYPVYQGVFEHHDPDLFINPTKPIHIIAGSAGCKEGMELFDNVFYGPWSIIRSSTYGYGHLLVHNKTHLYWDQLLAEGDAGKDIMWIVKGAEPTGTPTQSPTSGPTTAPNDSSSKVSKGAAAGVVVGIIVAVILGYCCWTTWYNRQTRKMRLPSVQGRAPLLLNQ